MIVEQPLTMLREHLMAPMHHLTSDGYQSIAEGHHSAPKDHQSVGAHQLIQEGHQHMVEVHQSMVEEHPLMAVEHRHMVEVHQSMAEGHRRLVLCQASAGENAQTRTQQLQRSNQRRRSESQHGRRMNNWRLRGQMSWVSLQAASLATSLSAPRIVSLSLFVFHNISLSRCLALTLCP